MTGDDIITKFETWTDDMTEMSEDDELFLANQKAREIYNEVAWEFLRKNVIGTFTGGSIDLATVAPDFKYFMLNYSDDPRYLTPCEPVVYIGTVPYRVVPMGMRHQYVGRQACYVDLVQEKVFFTDGLDSGTFDFDYQYVPDDFTAITSPPIPDDFQFIIVYAMLIDDDIIQKTEKARTNQKENAAKYAQIMSNLKSYNAKFLLQ